MKVSRALVVASIVLGTVLIVGGLIRPSHAQNAAGDDLYQPARALVDQAVAKVRAGDVVAAFDVLAPAWPIPNNEIDAVKDQTQRQRRMIGQRFGKPLGIDFVRRETAGDRLVQFIFIERFENHAIAWYFILYRPDDQWQVDMVFWNDQVSKLFPTHQ